MLFPIRCFTCGKPIADKWDEYVKRVGQGEKPAEVLDALSIRRYCCRRMFVSHAEVIDDVIQFSVSKTPEGTGDTVE